MAIWAELSCFGTKCSVSSEESEENFSLFSVYFCTCCSFPLPSSSSAAPSVWLSFSHLCLSPGCMASTVSRLVTDVNPSCINEVGSLSAPIIYKWVGPGEIILRQVAPGRAMRLMETLLPQMNHIWFVSGSSAMTSRLGKSLETRKRCFTLTGVKRA